MRALIVEDQPLLVSGLQAVMSGLEPPIAVSCADSVGAARHSLASEPRVDLVLLGPTRSASSGRGSGPTLALLSALEHRPAAAARLCGYSIAGYEKFEERRDVNEAAAFDRASRLAAGALGDAEFERLQAEGRSLRDEDVQAIAFGSRDA